MTICTGNFLVDEVEDLKFQFVFIRNLTHKKKKKQRKMTPKSNRRPPNHAHYYYYYFFYPPQFDYKYI